MATDNAPRGFPRILQWLLAGLMLIIGLAIGILGAKLASVGGTFYFALMGLVMVIAAVLIFRSRRGGIMLYAVAFVASIVWAISDAGWTYWPLFSRLFALGALSAHAVAAFGDGAREYDTHEALADALAADLHAGVRVLVKGSRGSAMDRIVKALLQRDAAENGGGTTDAA